MARAIWSGVITFGLVSVPVQMFTATEDHTLHFHQFERGTGDRVRNRRVNERTGEDVDYGDIVKGYDLGGGDYVMVEPDELAEIAPGRSQTIDVQGFVDLDLVAPVWFSRTYYLAPKGDEYTKIYELLRGALRGTGKIGIATFVMRAKQYLVALRAQDDVLVLHTLHWADEVRDPRRELPRLPDHDEAKSQELRTAEQLIEAMSVDWEPEQYHDTYEERVRELVDAKRKGEEVVSEEGPPEATNVVDLMDVLRRSVEDAETGRGGAGGGRRERASKKGDSGKRGSGKGAGAQEKAGSGRGTGKDGGKAAREGRHAAAKGGSGKRGAGGRGGRGGKGAGRGREELEALSKDELYRRATEAGVPGRSKMNRDELLAALAGEDLRAAS